ncbi:peptidoglycan-binding protein [Candidatus Nomurabacteria bacterium]|nr:peptidoglycan-binding protein [Candidatus Nomurabacteria bacterium]
MSKKSHKRIFGFSFLILTIMFLSFTSKAFAMTPTLSLSPTGDGDSVQVNVTGDPNSSVLIFYIKTGSGPQTLSLGTTNTNGTLTNTVSTSNYGVAAGSSVYITTGGINGAHSNTVAWPAVSSLLSSSNMLTLSQTGLVLTLGQAMSVTATNLNNSQLYQASNTSPQIANFSISGSQINVTANSYGTTTASFCLINNTSNCGSIYVIVQSSSAQPLTFSQSSVTLSPGQTVSVQISGGSGVYSVLNNSSQNNGVVTTSISSSTITLTTSGTTGSSSITVCSTDMNSCGIINVTIGNTVSSAVSFSQQNPTLAVAQSLNISIFGPTNSLFYVNSNSNPSIVQANLSGSTLTLLGITTGSSTISICASTSNCANLSVTVSTSSSGGALILSQQSVNLSVGQTSTVTISGGTMPYNIFTNSSNIFQATLNSNILTLVGLSNGTSLMNVCSAGGNCLTLSVYVGVTNPNALPTGCVSTTGFSQTTGQSCNTTTTTTTTTNTYVPVDCTGAAFSVSTGVACPANTITTTPVTTVTVPDDTINTPTTSTAFKFTKAIKLGSKGAEVTQLQKKLKTLGYFNTTATGTFGPITEKAVKAFQKAHKLPQVGNVGPLTRALLNK